MLVFAQVLDYFVFIAERNDIRQHDIVETSAQELVEVILPKFAVQCFGVHDDFAAIEPHFLKSVSRQDAR
ncbi:MAG: hypothetical protein HUJ51_03580 [Eggerthellaceae bacterium]|nr:hypothetical protein [Eggerthellaceae bacterium]